MPDTVEFVRHSLTYRDFPLLWYATSVAVTPSERNIDTEHTEFKDLESRKNGAFHGNHDQYGKDNEPMEYNTGLPAKNVVVC